MATTLAVARGEPRIEHVRLRFFVEDVDRLDVIVGRAVDQTVSGTVLPFSISDGTSSVTGPAKRYPW